MNDDDVVIKQLRQAREKAAELKRGDAPRVEAKEKRKFNAWMFYLIDLVLGLSAAAYVYFKKPRFSGAFLYVFKIEHFIFKIPYVGSWFEISFATCLFAMSVLYVLPIILVVLYEATQNKHTKTPKAEMDALYFRNLILLLPALLGAAITYGICKVPSLILGGATSVPIYEYGVSWIILTGFAAYGMSYVFIFSEES
ncbi:MAG: hypothetical protein M1491_10045 [Deltaproteobacteria bacterium]|nr:hypothetical protein [Deltaproteobacteria bacterium]